MGGILTDNDVRKNVVFVSYDNEAGQLVVRSKDSEQLIYGIEGRLLGYSKHVLTFKKKDYLKFDVFLEFDGVTYQVQLGMYSWNTLHIMNALMSMNGNADGMLCIRCYQYGGKNKSYLSLNGERLDWKYSVEQMNLPEDAEAREQKRDTIIDGMYSKLFEAHPYAEANGDSNVDAAVADDGDDEKPEFEDEGKPVKKSAKTAKNDIPF